MRELAKDACELQEHWTANNTDPMQRRGQLIRHDIPNWLSNIIPELAQEMGFVGNDLYAEGRDGTG